MKISDQKKVTCIILIDPLLTAVQQQNQGEQSNQNILKDKIAFVGQRQLNMFVVTNTDGYIQIFE